MNPAGNLACLLYVSRSTLPPADAAAGVAAIVAASRAGNPLVGLTGALLFTGEYFAQVLEGPGEAVDRLMASVTRDPRHTDILVVAREPITARRFGAWSMAYSGPSQFVARHVTRLLNEPRPPRRGLSAEWLADLLWEFAEGPGAA
jgi:hypothetical protein